MRRLKFNTVKNVSNFKGKLCVASRTRLRAVGGWHEAGDVITDERRTGLLGLALKMYIVFFFLCVTAVIRKGLLSLLPITTNFVSGLYSIVPPIAAKVPKLALKNHNWHF